MGNWVSPLSYVLSASIALLQFLFCPAIRGLSLWLRVPDLCTLGSGQKSKNINLKPFRSDLQERSPGYQGIQLHVSTNTIYFSNAWKTKEEATRRTFLCHVT
jgi:hypothetical protein